MRFVRIGLAVTLSLTPALLAQNTNQRIDAVNRTVNQLEESFNRYKTTNDEKLIELKLLLQQAVESSNKTSAAVTILESQMRSSMRDMEKNSVAPIAAVGSKVDTLADEFRFIRDSIADLHTKLGRLDNRLADVKSAVDSLQAPPAAPASQKPTADQLFNSGVQDRAAGRLDLSLQNFQEYLRLYPTLTYACVAQYVIGDIYKEKGMTQAALDAFDDVLGKYGEECDKAPDAHFEKGRALAKLNQRIAAGDEFRKLLNNPEWAQRARAELKALGIPATPPPVQKKTGRKGN